MKKLVYIVLLSISLVCHSQRTDPPTINYNNLKGSIFFSYNSVCNMKLEFLGNNNAILTMDGKAKEIIVAPNPENKGYYNIKKENSDKILEIFSFYGGDSELGILNQQYQHGCEPQKAIDLGKIDDDNKVLKDFIKYEKNTEERLYRDENIGYMNDKAYYLEQMHCYKTSEYILNKILAIVPDRVVAWLNLADVSWKQNKKEQAKESYQKYISLMKSQGKDLNKIPKRVYDRIK